MQAPSPFAAIIAATLVTACGGSSSPDHASGSAGTGSGANTGGTAGGGGIGGGSAGAGGGAGSSAAGCAFAEPESPRQVQFAPDRLPVFVRLAPLSSSAVTAVFSVGGSNYSFDPKRLSHASFDPWGPWSTNQLESTVLLPPPAGDRFAIAGGWEGTFSVFSYFAPPAPDAQGMFFATAIKPGTTGPSGLIVDPAFGTAEFLVAGKSDYLAGAILDPQQHGGSLELSRVAAGVVVAREVMAASSCPPRRAAAIRFEEGYLAAYSTSCAGSTGSTASLNLVRWADDQKPQLVHVVEKLEYVKHLHLVPRPGGAWLVYQAQNHETPADAHALPLGPNGAAVGPPLRLPSGGTKFDYLAVAPWRAGVLAAWHQQYQYNGVQIQALDSNGATGPKLTYLPAGEDPRDVALLPHPDETQAVLAWTGAPASGYSGGDAFVTRFRCSP